MKKIITSKLILGILFFSFTSCMVMRTGNFNPTATALNAANFKYVKLVSGESSTSSFLGIGEDITDLIARAKMDMYQNYPLKENQTYANVAVDITNSKALMIIEKTTIRITADIIEFTK
jgi:hypothetical protein